MDYIQGAQMRRVERRVPADGSRPANLAPAIGVVNAARSNYRFGLLPSSDYDWGSCPMKIHGRVAEPPDGAKGIVARTHLYMAEAYPARYRLSRAQQQLFEA